MKLFSQCLVKTSWNGKVSPKENCKLLPAIYLINACAVKATYRTLGLVHLHRRARSAGQQWRSNVQDTCAKEATSLPFDV